MEEKIFRTKTGYCHILRDRIELTRNGAIGSAAKGVSGNITRTLIIYVALTLFFAYKSFYLFKDGDNIRAGLYSLFVLFNIYAIARSVNNSSAPMILRSKIRSVVFNKAKPGLTRSYFEVLFEDDNGKIKKRLIMLPGSLSDGSDATKQALKIMHEEGLIK